VFSLDSALGELVIHADPSGCGKSMLLRIAAGLKEISGIAVIKLHRFCANHP
jgi:ABC-type nitrate/sulfonate/bicarbonate transport system ATPase subunit